MAYLAMARKWRPKNFEEMVGQDHIAQTIRNAIGGQRISHAYLFTGTRGVGKTTSARILAKALNCKNGPTATPCETCENCKAVNAGSSMDVLEIDAASNTGVDNIRDLREQVKYAPMHGTYKIYVVDEVHMLSKSAFNALLKTLEEPPPHVVFIFATTEVNKLPPTILSRVQRFDFKRISETRIRERLEFICGKEGIQPQREALEAVARKADGSMRDALSLFDQVYAFSGVDFTLEAARKVLGLPREKLFDGLVRSLAGHDQKACFDLLQEAHREGVETGDLLVAFGEYLRNLLFSAQGVTPSVLGLSDGRHGELAGLAAELRLKDGDILRYAKLVSDLLAGLKTAASPGLLVELGFARMASLDRVVTLSQLIGGELPDLPGPADEAGSKKKSPPESLTALPAPARAQVPEAPDLPPPGPAAPDVSAFAEAEPEAPVTSVIPPGGEPPPAPAYSSPEAGFEAAPRAVAVFTLPEPKRAPAPSPVAAAAAVEIPSAAADPDPEPPDLDYPADPDEPDMATLQALADAPRPAAAPEAPETVPMQEGAAALPRLWPALIGELMLTRPLLASQLRRTRLEWEGEGSPGLRLVFLEKSSHSLLADDGDFRKSILAFLGGKLRGGADFRFRFHLDEEAAADVPGAPVAVPEDTSGDEHIIEFTRSLFEGRTI